MHEIFMTARNLSGCKTSSSDSHMARPAQPLQSAYSIAVQAFTIDTLALDHHFSKINLQNQHNYHNVGSLTALSVTRKVKVRWPSATETAPTDEA